MPGEGDPVDVEVLDVHGVVRGELRGVEDDTGAMGMGSGGELTDGPQLAGDVRGARDAHQGGPVGVALGEGALQGLDGLVGRARRVQVRHAGVAPRQERGVVFGLEDEDLAVGGEHGGEQVERVGGRPGEDHLVVRAAAEELGDGHAGVLEEVGRQLREVPGTAVDAAVVRRVGGHVVPDPLERRGAGRVVEGRVGDLATGDERNGDIPAENRQRGTKRLVGGSGGDRHGELP